MPPFARIREGKKGYLSPISAAATNFGRDFGRDFWESKILIKL